MVLKLNDYLFLHRWLDIPESQTYIFGLDNLLEIFEVKFLRIAQLVSEQSLQPLEVFLGETIARPETVTENVC